MRTYRLYVMSVLALLLSALAWTKPISRDQALTAASTWLIQHPAPMVQHPSSALWTPQGVRPFTSPTGAALAYIVDLRPQGFIIVSADDTLEPVISFSTSGYFSGQSGPTHLLSAMLAKDIPSRLRMYARLNQAQHSVITNRWHLLGVVAPQDAGKSFTAGAPKFGALKVSVAPIIQDTWGQGDPATLPYTYNLDTPKNYVTGCVATAMSMIIHHFQYPPSASGSGTITVDKTPQAKQFTSTYNYTLMPTALVGGVSTNAQIQQVAQLMSDCGTAANADYEPLPAGTGATIEDAAAAFTGPFGYGSAVVKYGKDADWSTVLQGELQTGHPALMAIQNAATQEGHAIICDGYGIEDTDSSIRYHLNMGWDGQENNWYLVPGFTAGNILWDTLYGYIYNIRLPLTVPTLQKPANGAANVVIPTVFAWNTVASATMYNMQVATDPAFTTPIVNKNSLPATADTETLQASTKYYWRVQGSDGTTSSTWSAVWSFTTAAPVLTPPTLQTPADGATAVPTATAFAWNTVAGATVYNLQVATDPAFGTLIVNQKNLTGLTNTQTLQANTKYYWRVQASDGTTLSPWPLVWSFTTAAAAPVMPAPVLQTPADGATGVSTNTAFAWNVITSATVYSLQVATDPAFGAPIVNKNNLAVATDTDTLQANTKYYWRVQAGDGTTTSVWSAVWSFTTAAAGPVVPAPTLLSPLNGATGLTTPVTLKWNTVTGATGFNVEGSLDGGTTWILLVAVNGAMTSFSWNGLLPSVKYFWRVDALVGTSASNWSPVWSFQTAAQSALGVPALLSPADGAANVPLATDLTWGVVTGLTQYWARYALDAQFTSGVVQQNNLQAQVLPVTLAPNTKYFWTACAGDGSVWGAWAPPRAFTTENGQPVTVPVLISPAQSATGVAMPAACTWSTVPNATLYQTQVTTDITFTTALIDQYNAASTLTASGLRAGTQYYWRVRVRVDTTWGPWSSIWAFTTTTSAPVALQPPVLVSPADGATNVPAVTQLQWNAVDGAAGYDVQYACDQAFTTGLVTRANMTGLTCTERFFPGIKYYWRARAGNGTARSAWSTSRSFTVAVPITQSGVDLMINTMTIGDRIGEGIMDPKQDQSTEMDVPYGKQAIYTITVKNNEQVNDAFVITGSSGSTGWTVNFFDATGRDITKSVTNATWTTPTLTPGQEITLRLEVTPFSGLSNGDSLEIRVLGQSILSSACADMVGAITTKIAWPQNQ